MITGILAGIGVWVALSLLAFMTLGGIPLTISLITEKFTFWRDRRTARHYTSEAERFPSAPADIAGAAALTPEEDDRFRDLTETFRMSKRRTPR